MALIALGIALLIAVIVGAVVVIRRHCKLRGEYTHLDENDYDFDVPPSQRRAVDVVDLSAAVGNGVGGGGGSHYHNNKRASKGLQSSTMWVSSNPTDYYRDDSANQKVDPVAAAQLKARLERVDDDRTERNRFWSLSCANYCRSITTHQRTVHTPLPNIGHRGDTNKYYALVTDAYVNRVLNRSVSAVMTLTTVNVSSPSAKSGGGAVGVSPIKLYRQATQQRVRAVLQALSQHPHILPTLDVGIVPIAPTVTAGSVLPSAGGSGGSGSGGGDRLNAFIVREYLSDTGSVRDMIHETQPALLYRVKYGHTKVEQRTLTYPIRYVH